MPIVIPRREVWTWQPQQAVDVNKSHPLGGRIIGAWVSSCPDSISGNTISTITKTGTTQSVKANGIGTNFGTYAGTGIINLPATEAYRFYNKSGTIVAGVTLGSLVSGQYEPVYCLRDGTTNANGLLFGLDGTTYSGGRVAGGFGTTLVGTSGSAKQNTYATYGYEFGTSRRALYVNGVLDASDVANGIPTNNTIVPSLGNRQTGGRALQNGYLHWCILVDGLLGDAWHKHISNYPYKIFQP